MYIEFDILQSYDDFNKLERAVSDWAQEQNIPYTTKVAKGLKYRLGLNHPEHFTVFFLTWRGCEYCIKNANQY